MNIILEYSLPQGQTRKVWLSVDQALRFGSTSPADVIIDFDPSMAGVHFSVTGQASEWRIASLGYGNKVFVNGQAVHYQLLQHGDTIQAGSTLFRVAIDGKSAEPNPSIPEVNQAPAPPAESQPLSFVTKRHTSNVVEFAVALLDKQLHPFLNALISDDSLVTHHWYCALNTKRFGRQPLHLTTTGKDLFEHAPEEIRLTDALEVSLIGPPFNPEVIAETIAACRANAASLLVTPLELPDLLDNHKLVWAWFSRPAILSQQLTLGSSILAEKLLLEREFILFIEPAANAGVRIITQTSYGDALQSLLETIRLTE